MINKRNFLKTGAGAIVAGAGSTAAIAAVRPSLNELSGAASWQAHVGQRFDVDGHSLTLQAVERGGGGQGEQFSLRFAGACELGEGLHRLSLAGGEPLLLFLAATPHGLRADFCRLPG